MNTKSTDVFFFSEEGFYKLNIMVFLLISRLIVDVHASDCVFTENTRAFSVGELTENWDLVVTVFGTLKIRFNFLLRDHKKIIFLENIDKCNVLNFLNY